MAGSTALAGIQAVVFDLDEKLTTRGTPYRGRVTALLHTALARKAGRRRAAGECGQRLAPVRLLRRRCAALCRRVALDSATEQLLDTVQRAGDRIGSVTNGTASKRHTISLLGRLPDDRATGTVRATADDRAGRVAVR